MAERGAQVVLRDPPRPARPRLAVAEAGQVAAAARAGFLLWYVTLRWQREIATALAPLGLTHVQFVLLAAAWWLNSRGEDPNQLSAARQAGTDVKMTSEVLHKLEGKGLVVRTVDAAFFRAVPDPGALLAMLRTLARGGG